MASGHKQKPTNDFIMMRPGLRAQIPASPSLASSSARVPLQFVNAGYENTDDLSRSHDYEDLERYNQIPSLPRKANNAIYQSTTPSRNIPPSPQIKNERERHFTECSDTDSTSTLMHSGTKDRWFFKVLLVIILIISITSLTLVLLMIFGFINPKCGCNNKTPVNTKQHLTRVTQASVSTVSLVERINKLERNTTSQIARNVIMSSLLVKHQREILELKSKLAGFLVNQEEGPSANKFKQNITTEMQKLREKQVQLGSSLTNLKENDKTKTTDIQEMKTKVIGLAVAVKFLSTNDSLIKSKVHDLSLAKVKFTSSLESLKQKDSELDESLQRAKSVEAFLNSSMSQLKSVDGELKTKMDQLNSTFMTKINNITGSGQGVQGPPGPPGPPGASGAGNLSQCYHQQEERDAAPGKTGKNSVPFVVPKDKIVVGATCSTIRGDETNLLSRINQNGQKVYSCECKGESNFQNNSGKMKCLIDVWVCPRIS